MIRLTKAILWARFYRARAWWRNRTIEWAYRREERSILGLLGFHDDYRGYPAEVRRELARLYMSVKRTSSALHFYSLPGTSPGDLATLPGRNERLAEVVLRTVVTGGHSVVEVDAPLTAGK